MKTSYEAWYCPETNDLVFFDCWEHAIDWNLRGLIYIGEL